MRFGKALIAGCVRNAAIHLPAVLANIDLIASVFDKSSFVFVENDSSDATVQILKAWSKGRNAHILSAPGLVHRLPIRTMRLACARNALIAVAKTYFGDCDVLVILDMDDVATRPLDIDAVIAGLELLRAQGDIAAVTANKIGQYYDLWALRHPTHCPGDVWEEMYDSVVLRGEPEAQAHARIFGPAFVHIDPNLPPIEVESAYAGLAFYRMKAVVENAEPYVGHRLKMAPSPAGMRPIGFQACEHVSFHRGLRAQGQKIVILPALVNMQSEVSEFPPSAYRGLMFDPRLTLAGQITIPLRAERNDPCPCGSGKRLKHCHGR